MEIRTLARKNTITLLNKQAILQFKKSEKQISQQNKENLHAIKYPFKQHHAFKYLRGTIPSQSDFKKFVNILYKGTNYGVNSLKGPSQNYIKTKRIKLQEPVDTKNKKILFMDLDQTLIHSVYSGDKRYTETDVKLEYKEGQFNFNIRPNCFQFLERMSKHYNIYVFTAASKEYAQVIINYLNKKRKCILGFLHRKNCMQTNNGYLIKDLRIVGNRNLKDIILVDNLVHSFGLQIENGIPILEFTDQKQDRQLEGLQRLLIQLANVHDVRQYIKSKLDLRKILEYHENVYTRVQSSKHS